MILPLSRRWLTIVRLLCWRSRLGIGINRLVGYKFKKKLGKTEKELIEDGIAAHGY